MEVKPYNFRHTLLHVEHLQLCTLTPFQGVGRPINTTLQGLGDWELSHKMLSGDWYTLVSLFLSSGYCLSHCLPSWKVRMVTFPQQDQVGLNMAVVNLTCLCIHSKRRGGSLLEPHDLNKELQTVPWWIYVVVFQRVSHDTEWLIYNQRMLFLCDRSNFLGSFFLWFVFISLNQRVKQSEHTTFKAKNRGS